MRLCLRGAILAGVDFAGTDLVGSSKDLEAVIDIDSYWRVFRHNVLDRDHLRWAHGGHNFLALKLPQKLLRAMIAWQFGASRGDIPRPGLFLD